MSNSSDILKYVKDKNINEPEFIQAVEEFLESVVPYVSENAKYQDTNILRRIVEPERIVMFRVPWLDDSGKHQVNRGFRVEYNSYDIDGKSVTSAGTDSKFTAKLKDVSGENN